MNEQQRRDLLALRTELAEYLDRARGDVTYRAALVDQRERRLAALDALEGALQLAKQDAVALRDARLANSSSGLLTTDLVERVNGYAAELEAAGAEDENVDEVENG